MKFHKVKKGEHLILIASQYDIPNWADIYNHKANERLRRFRPDPMCLKEGDIVYIPDSEPIIYKLATNQKHKIILDIPKIEINMIIRFNEQDVLADTQYRLESGDFKVENKTNNQGLLKEKIPAQISNLHAIFYPEESPQFSLLIDVGNLDPDDEVTGVQQRLCNLGYYEGAIDDDFGHKTESALQEFQIDYDIDPAEGLNADTILLINKIYENKSR